MSLSMPRFEPWTFGLRTLGLRRSAVLRVVQLWLLLSSGALPAAEPPGPPPLDKTHLERATELIVEQRLAEGCVELQLAHDETRDPLLLLRIARLRQRLGDKEAARAAYKRFLIEAKSPHPGLKAEAEEALRALNPPPPPPPPIGDTAPALPPPPLFEQLSEPGAEGAIYRGPPRRNKRLMKIGGLLLSAGYLPALVIPLGLSTSLDRENAPTRAANYTLLIPLAGPFISGILAPATNDNGHAGQIASSWSVPWMATSGLLQVTGFTLLVFGAMKR
jgi:hypothetical protein